MPRFYFDTDDGSNLRKDLYGIELLSQEEARNLAVRTLPDIAQEAVCHNDKQKMAVYVRDEADDPVLDATLSLDVKWKRPE